MKNIFRSQNGRYPACGTNKLAIATNVDWKTCRVDSMNRKIWVQAQPAPFIERTLHCVQSKWYICYKV